MLERELLTSDSLRARFADIEPMLHRFPAIDPPSFTKALDEFVA